MNAFRLIAAPAVLSISLATPAFADAPGSSSLDRIVIHEALPREASIGGISHDVALSRLRQKGYKIAGPLTLRGQTWVATDAKTGKPLHLDAKTGAIVSALAPAHPLRHRRFHKN